MINVREADSHDAPFIMRCLVEQAIIHDSPCHATEEKIQYQLSAREPRLRGVIVEHHGKPSGMSLYYYTFRTLLCQRVIYIEDTFILEDSRHNGLARAILRFYQDVINANKAAYIEWSMLSTNSEARAAYEKLGAVAEPHFLTYRWPPADEWLQE